jgi:hypothetical protein
MSRMIGPPETLSRMISKVICEEIENLLRRSSATEARIRYASDFAVEQIGKMPSHFRLGLIALSAWFGLGLLWTLVLEPPRRSDAAVRSTIRRWSESRLGIKRDYVRLHASLATFAITSMRIRDSSLA